MKNFKNQVDDEDEFEKYLSTFENLPSQYIEFLKESNGGFPDKCVFEYQGKVGRSRSSINLFYGITHRKESNTLDYAQALIRPNKSSLYVIAQSVFGDFIVINQEWQIQLLKHDTFETPCLIANNFETFLSSLEQEEIDALAVTGRQGSFSEICMFLEDDFSTPTANEILCEAAVKGRTEIIYKLINNGVKKNNLLYELIYNGFENLVIELLEQFEDDFKQEESSYNRLLIWATEFNNPKIIRYLHSKGWNINQFDDYGNSLLASCLGEDEKKDSETELRRLGAKEIYQDFS